MQELVHEGVAHAFYGVGLGRWDNFAVDWLYGSDSEAEARQKVLYLEREGADLAQRLGVSVETVRRDLQILEDRGLVVDVARQCGGDERGSCRWAPGAAWRPIPATGPNCMS